MPLGMHANHFAMINIRSRLVDVFDVDAISLKSGDDIRLRLEVFFDMRKKQYGIKVYRLEFYALRPAFSVCDDAVPVHDALIHVLDEHFMGHAFHADSIKASVQLCLEEINRVFDY